jgi:hypothetical protein
MTADRFFFPAVLAACAAVTLLSVAEPARVAQAQAWASQAATPVVQLERVVITAAREDVSRVATATASQHEVTAVIR